MVAGNDLGGLPDLRPWGVDFAALKREASNAAAVALADEAPLLTDDFAPVEYLDIRSR
jgi:hypothetical protein